MVEEAAAEIISAERFTDRSDAMEAKPGEIIVRRLNGRAVFAFQSKRWMFWDSWMF